IRYYTAEGLLPPPDTRGRYALYGEDHLRRLQLIARLKDAYLPLSEIRAQLKQLTAGQVQQVLADYQEAPVEASPGSATAYLAQLLAHLATRHEALQPRSSAPLGYTPATSAADPATFQVGLAPSSEQPRAFQLGHAEPSADQLPIPTPTDSTLPSSSAVPGRESATSFTRPGEIWRRIILAPGVELHVLESGSPAVRERVEDLIAYARGLFQDKW
ncbi:MAG: MerR family transcriptional regulator, partial [Chloroflexota bacterium]|nr:MerR family transcriptional regulator [Chloroflexota bacterium]